MKFKEMRMPWGSNKWFNAVKGGFEFTYSTSNQNGELFVMANHKTKDIRYNSLWESLTFETKEEVEVFCENFDYVEHSCLGKDL